VPHCPSVARLGGASGAGVQPEGHHIVREDTWMKCIACVEDKVQPYDAGRGMGQARLKPQEH
jgi:hypothetical protein